MAHVTVVPAQSVVGVEERYMLRVPTEKPIATVAITLEFPANVIVIDFQPKPGWDRAVEYGPGQQIVSATWSGGSIAPGEFDEFGFEARNPKERGSIVWRAVQTYADGTRVEWTGAEDSETPAPVTEIVPVGAPGPAQTGSQSPASGSTSDAGLYVALIATVVSALALILAVAGLGARRWPLRPDRDADNEPPR